MKNSIDPNLKHNLIVNLLDGSFFGMALGFASFVTILPLFVSTLTDSAILIGLIPAIHSVGWQLPQLLTARRVAGQRKFKPMVMWMTLNERAPFLGLALVAWLAPRIDPRLALGLTFALLIWQGLGGGLTATAWQSMIGHIIPSQWRGTFYGTQSAVANLLGSIAAISAGWILQRYGSPNDFVYLFLLASLSMAVSAVFLGFTRETPREVNPESSQTLHFRRGVWAILKRDLNFRWFLGARMVAQFGAMAFAFYTVFAVRHHGVTEAEIGWMTGVFLGAQIVSNPILGWLGDRWSHRVVMEIGATAAAISALTAWWAPTPAWFYLVFGLAGIANVSLWTTNLAMVLQFGEEHERPAYIGLANTLIAPATFLAPIFAGWLVEGSGYPAAFLASAGLGVATVAMLQLFVRDPGTEQQVKPSPAPCD